MYRTIARHPTTRQLYAERLVAEGVLSAGRGRRDGEPSSSPISKPSSRPAKNYRPNKADWLEGAWAGLEPAPD